MRLDECLPQELVAWINSGIFKGLPLNPQIFAQEKLPLDWWKKNKDGITFKGKVYLRKAINLSNPNSMKLLFHELIHVRQFSTMGFFWWVNYIFDANKIEEEAYRESHDWTLKYLIDFPQYALNLRTLNGDDPGHRCGLQ